MSLLNNPICWANFQISGGPVRSAWVAASVAVVLPALIFGSTRIEPDSADKALKFWYLLLSILQGGLLLFGLPGRVHGAMRRDRASKLIESHRLMPVPAHHAIAGYLLGPNLLLLACAAAVFVIGLFVASFGGEDPRGWLAMHVAFAVVTTTLCCVVAFSSQWLPRLNPALLLIFVVPALGIGSATIVPALSVMFGPFFMRLPQIQAGDLEPRVLVGGGAQLVLAAILFVGACRRYRRDDVPALGFGWGFALLALWVGITLFGILEPQSVGTFRRGDPEDVPAAFIVSVTLSMLLAIGPVASAATSSLAWGERKITDPHFDARRPIRVGMATLLVLALLSTLLLAAPRHVTATRDETIAYPAPYVSPVATSAATAPTTSPPVTAMTYTVSRTVPVHETTWRERSMVFGILATFLVTIGLLAWAAGRMRVPVLAVIAFWIVVTWVMPAVVDGARVLFSGEENATFPGPVGAASPPFGLGAIWMGDLTAAGAGLIAQAALVPLLLIAWQLLKRHNGRASLALPASIANA